VRGASKGEGLGNQFLANIRECDAIAHVVRCFEDGDVTHVEGRIDPLSDIATVETELMLADLESLERRIVAMEKKTKGGDKDAKDLLALAQRSLAELPEGRPARAAGVSREEHDLFQSLGLLSSKPVLYVCNVDDASADKGNGFSDLVKEQAAKEGAASVVVSAKIESEIAILPQAEQKDYLEAVGLTEPGLNRVIRAGYDLLHLVTFFTAGPKEARAWTVEKGARVPQAAGVIHTDFEKGFIRAETIAYDDYVANQGEARARRANFVWKAKTMSSPTAMSCISGSPTSVNGRAAFFRGFSSRRSRRIRAAASTLPQRRSSPLHASSIRSRSMSTRRPRSPLPEVLSRRAGTPSRCSSR
jgi:GTP-binding protein YchF